MDYTHKSGWKVLCTALKIKTQTCAYLYSALMLPTSAWCKCRSQTLADFWFVADLETDMSSLWIVVHMTPKKCLMRRCKTCISLASSRRCVSQSVDTRHIHIWYTYTHIHTPSDTEHDPNNIISMSVQHSTCAIDVNISNTKTFQRQYRSHSLYRDHQIAIWHWNWVKHFSIPRVGECNAL